MLASVLLPVFVANPVFAAKTYPAGTCFYAGPDGNKIVSCKSLGITTSQKDSNGKPVSYANCYAIAATTSSVGITQVNCDNTSMTKSVQMCPTATAGKDVPCVTCPDGSFADTTVDCPPGNSDPAVTSGNCATASHCDLIVKYINPLINLLAALVGVAVTISIIVGGIQYASSGGDPQKVTLAKTRIRGAIIALITFIFLYALLNFLIPGGLI
jgi:hypothetical protein